MNKKTFQYILISLILLTIVLLHVPSGSRTSLIEVRDTTIYRVYHRDTTIYNVELRDSVAYDVSLVPMTDFDTVVVHDSVFVAVPLSWYHFHVDSTADVYATGYMVTLDSVKYHFREVTKLVEKNIVIKPKRLSVDIGSLMLRDLNGWTFRVDGCASLRLGERWSVEGGLGLWSNGHTMSPFAAVGVRYSLSTE